jgi:uncharacterized cupin superfamily protein
MFERFTDRARRVVVLAQDEARMLHHDYIGTEHILLGLIHEGEGVAAKALESLNISLEAVRQQVEEMIGQGHAAPTDHIPFSPRAKKVLELSLREALQLGHNYIGTEHILLGLIREGEGVAAQVLQILGADLYRVRQTVIQLLSGYTGGEGEQTLGEAHHPESGSGVYIPIRAGPWGVFAPIGVAKQPEVYVSNLETEDFEPDPEVGGETHMLRDSQRLQAGLWRLPAAASWEPFTLTLEHNETILILEGAVRIEITGAPTLDLVAGDMASLSAGMETTWIVQPPFKEFWVLS